MIVPEIVAHADWGAKPRKRQLASARLRSSRMDEPPSYLVTSLELADQDLLGELRRTSQPGQALVGFDYPIGLPRAYARLAEISSFTEFLFHEIGTPPWERFTEVARAPTEVSIHRPFYPDAPGGSRREHLYSGLGLTGPELRRRCEREDAETMFWTLGGKQVGKGALAGWKLLSTARRRNEPPMALWPFDGPLDSLLDGSDRVIVAETYPRAYYPFIQPRGVSVAKWSKRRREDRLTWVPTLLKWAQSLGVSWDETVLRRVEQGFSNGPDGEDEFDAVVGLVAMVAVVSGVIPSGEPDDEEVSTIEGWILGRPCYLDVSMPDWFALEFERADGVWMDEAFCIPELFCRNRDGSYLRSDGGSGLWIRAAKIDQYGVIDHVDGGGVHHRYRLMPLPSTRYPGVVRKPNLGDVF